MGIFFHACANLNVLYPSPKNVKLIFSLDMPVVSSYSDSYPSLQNNLSSKSPHPNCSDNREIPYLLDCGLGVGEIFEIFEYPCRDRSRETGIRVLSFK